MKTETEMHSQHEAQHVPCPRRKRGGLLLDIILGLLLLVGLIYGAYSYFQQGSTSQDLADINSRFVALSAEVRAQHANSVNYPNTLNTAFVRNNSTIKESQFRNVTIAATGGQTFTIAIGNLSDVVCNRLLTADLGPRSSGAACTGTAGSRVLTVTYTG